MSEKVNVIIETSKSSENLNKLRSAIWTSLGSHVETKIIESDEKITRVTVNGELYSSVKEADESIRKLCSSRATNRFNSIFTKNVENK